jgi:WD40 repeat protein
VFFSEWIPIAKGSYAFLRVSLAGRLGVFSVDGQQQMEWKALHTGRVYDVDWARADRCASASANKTCKVWQPQTGVCVCVCVCVCMCVCVCVSKIFSGWTATRD